MLSRTGDGQAVELRKGRDDTKRLAMSEGGCISGLDGSFEELLKAQLWVCWKDRRALREGTA